MVEQLPLCARALPCALDQSMPLLQPTGHSIGRLAPSGPSVQRVGPRTRLAPAGAAATAQKPLASSHSAAVSVVGGALAGLALAVSQRRQQQRCRSQRELSGRVVCHGIVAGVNEFGGNIRAYRMPLPPDVHEIQPPRWNVLLEAVENKPVEEAFIPTWKLKPKLGIYSPTPQYHPLHYIEPKPSWKKAAFVKRKMNKFYEKQMRERQAKLGVKLRHLPGAWDRLSRAGAEVIGGINAFKTEADSWKELRSMSGEDILEAMKDQTALRLGAAAKTILPNWRPGFQTKAIKDMAPHLKRVDVVLEVRDARIPWATMHPDVPQWVHPKPRVIVLTRADLVPPACLEETISCIRASDRDRGCPVVAVDSQKGGKSVEALRLELMKAGAYVNRRRRMKGINPRAIRTMMIGFPNVGKSSIINRLVGRKVANKSRNAGFTKKMIWHKIGGYKNTELEFLDTPGFIPVCFSKRYTEEQASLLCICKIFTQKEIDRESCIYDLVYLLGKLWRESPHMIEKTVWRETKRMYGVDYLAALRQEEPFFPLFVPIMNPDPYCGKLLADFNRGYWGKIQLELPPPEYVEKMKEWEHLRKVGVGVEGTKLLKVPRAVRAGSGVNFKLLTAPKEMPRLPMKFGKAEEGAPEKERVPMHVFKAEGLFDGW